MYIRGQSQAFRQFRFQYLQFQFIGKMDFTQYLYANTHLTNSGARRSGDLTNGYQFGNSAPVNVAFNGNIGFATASIRGLATNSGSPAANVNLLFELWKPGFSGGEGTKIGDISFNIVSANYTLGNFFNSSIVTAFAERQAQNVDVVAGDLLALKFIRQLGNAFICASENTTIVLELVGEEA